MAWINPDIRRLILASGSPRRRQLLSLLGVPFVIKVAEVDETPHPGEPPSEMVLRVSRDKALAAGQIGHDELVIAADTVVVLDGHILGKPADAAQAGKMLRLLRNRSHLVYTGVAVWHGRRRRMVQELGESVVWMRNYGDDEIATYVDSGDPMDKAGAYAIQHRGFQPVARIDGCWLNVMGLPLCHLARALASFGLSVPANVPGACQAFNQHECKVSFSGLSSREQGGSKHGV
ncbi:MAG: Maf family protein [Anaerolineae bacterium]|jgi:MAF protein